jgi:hypothetical protein
MSTAAIVGAAVAVLAAVIGAVSLLLVERRKRIEENRKLAIRAYGVARTAWDQAQINDVTESVRHDKFKELRRGLVEIKLLVGKKVQTKDFQTLIALLDLDLLSPAHVVELALARTIWPQADEQIQELLAPS